MQVESQPRLTRAAAVNSVMWKGEEEALTKNIIFRLLPPTLQSKSGRAFQKGQRHQMNHSWGWGVSKGTQEH